MYAMAAGDVLPGETTTLLSPSVRVTSQSCISFMYYHYTRGAADTMVSLSVAPNLIWISINHDIGILERFNSKK